jgi:hypothetical protein
VWCRNSSNGVIKTIESWRKNGDSIRKTDEQILYRFTKISETQFEKEEFGVYKFVPMLQNKSHESLCKQKRLDLWFFIFRNQPAFVWIVITSYSDTPFSEWLVMLFFYYHQFGFIN